MSSIASSALPFDQRQNDLLKASGTGDEKTVHRLIDDSLWSSQTDKVALRQALQRVSGRGNLRLAEFLLKRGAEVNVDRDGKGGEVSALYQAAKAGHNKIVELLVRAGADTEYRDKDGRTALFTPAMRGFTETVGLLLQRANPNARDKDGRTVLIHLAAEKTKWMEEDKKKVEDKKPRGKKGEERKVEEPKKELTEEEKRAEVDKKYKMIYILLQKGADINATDKTRRTALSWASSTGKHELVDYLLSGRVFKKADITSHNSKQQTALHWASENNHPEVVRVLLHHGADPAARSDGRWTALHMAAQRGHVKVVILLLDQGEKTPVNSQLTNGMTALHWAAFKGHEEVVRLLLARRDTHLGIKDTYDRTALLCAAENKHRDIVILLSPGMTGERLPSLVKEASKSFQATVVDFGEFRDGKKQLVFKDHSVYDLLHGWDHEKNKPLVHTHVKNVRHQPAFRWIHLPANNISWVETLLAKAFIEGGTKDIEDFKALEKCFNQEHRGPEAHAHFMRPWSQRYAISPYRAEKAEILTDTEAGAERLDPVLEQSAATLVVTPPEGEALPPGTPTRREAESANSHDETPASERKKKRKGKKEEIADRHPTRPKRRNGPSGDGQNKKKNVDKAPSGAPKQAPPTPGANGKIVLFMPFLHYESDGKRQRMAEAVRRALYQDPLPEKACPDDLLIQAYLNDEPPLHVRRTLDQFFYHSIDTSERDIDQVVYRHFKKNVRSKEPMIFMVDQLWMWILGKELIVTCFPQRWDQPLSEDPLNVLLGIIEDMNAKTRPPITSVYDLAMLITGRCCGIFDRHRLENEHYQFLDMFEIAIGHITNRETRLFEEFKRASAATSMYLMDVNNSSRRYPEGRPPERTNERPMEYSKFLVDISVETQLLAEIKDIRDELQIITMVLQYQINVLPESAENIIRELGGKKSHEATEIERKKKEQIKLIEVHMKDIERMMRQTQGIYLSLTNLLDLKQKHANAFEARFASNQAALTARQGQTILVFTIVTIIFLPMSFIAAFFAINLREFTERDGGRGLSISYVAKYMFGIGLGVSLPLVIIALAFDDVGIFMRRSWQGLKRFFSGKEREPLPGKDGRQLSDLEHKVHAILDVPRASMAEKSRRSLDLSNGDLRGTKHLVWEDTREIGVGVAGIGRVRRESRASRGSNLSRPKFSFDRRRMRFSDDMERGRDDDVFLRGG